MKNRDTFSGFHPIVNFLYFGLVIGCGMVFMHPVCLLISLVCSINYAVYLNGRKAIRFNLIYLLPMLIMTALLNPMFNHEGATILMYLPSDNPLTLESIIYGVAAAVMLITVISWFTCYNAIVTSDKFIYLFGRIIPSISLILSMALRFVPKFKMQIKSVSFSQRCIGRDVSNGSLLQRSKNAITILSIMITWVLENAIETADSMKSRGYGLPGRSAFSIYRFDKRDRNALIFFLLCGAYVITGYVLGGIYWQYFPIIFGIGSELYSISIFICYFALCIAPVIINVKEDRKWTRLRSAI